MAKALFIPLAVVALWMASAPARVASQAMETFAVAVVREDGIMVPFARFDGTAWERISPDPSADVDVPTSLREVRARWFPPDGRVPESWHLWPIVDPHAAASPFEARTGRPLAPQRVVSFDAHCQQGVGVQTDYRGSEDGQPAKNTHPGPKAGIAITSPTVRVDQPVSLDPASPLARWAADRATLSFHRAEDDHLENFDAAERPKLEPFAVRKSRPVDWTRIVRLGTAQAAERTYYLEGEVTYSPRTIMVGHVWLQVAGDREATDAEAVLTDEDHKNATRRKPLGVVRLAARRFWVFETHGYEDEAFEVFEVSDVSRAPVPIIEVAAGGC